MEDLSTFWRVLLSICAGAMSIWGVAKAVSEIKRMATKPTDTLTEKLAELEAKIASHARMLDNDNRRINEQDESLRLILGGMLQLMNHEIDGNHSQQLHEQRDKIESYLINR